MECIRAVQDLGVTRRLLLEGAGMMRFPGRLPAELQDHVVGTRLHRVMQHPKRVWVVGDEQTPQHLEMEADPRAGRQGGRNDAPRQLVPERHALPTQRQDAHPLRLRNGVQVLAQGVQETQLNTAGDHGATLDRPTSPVTECSQPAQNGVDDCRGDLDVRGGQHFGDEEGVASGGAVELWDVDVGIAGQLVHGLGTQRR